MLADARAVCQGAPAGTPYPLRGACGDYSQSASWQGASIISASNGITPKQNARLLPSASWVADKRRLSLEQRPGVRASG